MEYYDIRNESFRKTITVDTKAGRRMCNWTYKNTNKIPDWVLLGSRYLAKLGFYFSPTAADGFAVTCSACDLVLEWSKMDHPLQFHLQNKPCDKAKLWGSVLKLERPNDERWATAGPSHDKSLLDKTYTNWPHGPGKTQPTPTADQMAEAGFIFQPITTSADQALCPYCEVSMVDFEVDDNPLELHKELNPGCAFFTKLSTFMEPFKLKAPEPESSSSEDEVSEEEEAIPASEGEDVSEEYSSEGELEEGPKRKAPRPKPVKRVKKDPSALRKRRAFSGIKTSDGDENGVQVGSRLRTKPSKSYKEVDDEYDSRPLKNLDPMVQLTNAIHSAPKPNIPHPNLVHMQMNQQYQPVHYPPQQYAHQAYPQQHYPGYQQPAMGSYPQPTAHHYDVNQYNTTSNQSYSSNSNQSYGVQPNQYQPSSNQVYPHPSSQPYTHDASQAYPQTTTQPYQRQLPAMTSHYQAPAEPLVKSDHLYFQKNLPPLGQTQPTTNGQANHTNGHSAPSPAIAHAPSERKQSLETQDHVKENVSLPVQPADAQLNKN
ncbi:hypothetical protein BC833DRAFT_624128 [Globomyces pollinis-pini]|nr:hypothetical protein BC833DRAFT_624128 [Globomyces pollinis-pini]